MPNGFINRNESEVVPDQKHNTVRVVYGDQQADIDEAITSLIFEMWRAGIRTFQSCQDNPPGWVWLQFDDTAELQKFLGIVGDDDQPGDLLNHRMRSGYGLKGGFEQWDFRLVVNDWGLDEIVAENGEIDEIRIGPPDFGVLTCVHFPKRDLSTVVARLIVHNMVDGSGAAPSEMKSSHSG